MSHHQNKLCCLPDKARGKVGARHKAGRWWVGTLPLAVSFRSLQGPVPATCPISAKARWRVPAGPTHLPEPPAPSSGMGSVFVGSCAEAGRGTRQGIQELCLAFGAPRIWGALKGGTWRNLSQGALGQSRAGCWGSRGWCPAS